MTVCVVSGSAVFSASSVHGGGIEYASLEYSSVQAYSASSSGSGWLFTSPDDFDASGGFLTEDYANSSSDLTFQFGSWHSAGVDFFSVGASTESGFWVASGTGYMSMGQEVTIDDNSESVYLRYSDYVYSESGIDAPDLEIWINASYVGSYNPGEEISVQGGDVIKMNFNWGSWVFPDEDMGPGFTLNGMVAIYESNTVVPGPMSLAILGFGGFIRRRRHRG